MKFMQKKLMLITLGLVLSVLSPKEADACSPLLESIKYPTSGQDRGSNWEPLKTVSTNGLFQVYYDYGQSMAPEVRLVKKSAQGVEFPLSRVREDELRYGGNIYFFQTASELDANTDYLFEIKNRWGDSPSTREFKTSGKSDSSGPVSEGIEKVEIDYHGDGEAYSYTGWTSCGPYTGEILAVDMALIDLEEGVDLQPMLAHYHITVKLHEIEDESGSVLVSLYRRDPTGNVYLESNKVFTPDTTEFALSFDETPGLNSMSYLFKIEDIFGNESPESFSVDITLAGDDSTFSVTRGGSVPPPPPPHPAGGCSLIQEGGEKV